MSLPGPTCTLRCTRSLRLWVSSLNPANRARSASPEAPSPRDGVRGRRPPPGRSRSGSGRRRSEPRVARSDGIRGQATFTHSRACSPPASSPAAQSAGNDASAANTPPLVAKPYLPNASDCLRVRRDRNDGNLTPLRSIAPEHTIGPGSVVLRIGLKDLFLLVIRVL